MATTTNYGWTTPDDTALVKDGAAAIRTLGSSVDTTTKNLNPSTTLGDIEYRSSTANTNTRLAIGTSGQALTVVAGAPSWAASPTSVLTTIGDTLYASAANTLARLGIGSTNQVLTVAGGVPTWATPAAGAIASACFTDEKSVNTSGGTFTSGAWRTRDLNTSQFNNISGASIASNQITLGAGTYAINAVLPFYQVVRNQGRLQNITDSTTTILGGSMVGVDNVAVIASVIGTFTIAGTKVFELQHQCDTTKASSGFGLFAGFTTEVYAQIHITKLG
jgi:hypothetical protein